MSASTRRRRDRRRPASRKSPISQMRKEARRWNVFSYTIRPCWTHLSSLFVRAPLRTCEKNTTENFAPRESQLALIVGSRSWWQTKAASFLLAPRPLECLVTGNLATKSRVFDRYSPPVVRAGRVPRARTCCYRRAATWSPFCFDITLRSLPLLYYTNKRIRSKFPTINSCFIGIDSHDW